MRVWQLPKPVLLQSSSIGASAASSPHAQTQLLSATAAAAASVAKAAAAIAAFSGMSTSAELRFTCTTDIVQDLVACVVQCSGSSSNQDSQQSSNNKSSNAMRVVSITSGITQDIVLVPDGPLQRQLQQKICVYDVHPITHTLLPIAVVVLDGTALVTSAALSADGHQLLVSTSSPAQHLEFELKQQQSMSPQQHAALHHYNRILTALPTDEAAAAAIAAVLDTAAIEASFSGSKAIVLRHIHSGHTQSQFVVRACFGGHYTAQGKQQEQQQQQQNLSSSKLLKRSHTVVASYSASLVLSGSENGAVYVWHATTATAAGMKAGDEAQPPACVLPGHTASVNATVWMPAGVKAVSISSNDNNSSSNNTSVVRQQQHSIMFVSCSDDHTIRLWGKQQLLPRHKAGNSNRGNHSNTHER